MKIKSILLSLFLCSSCFSQTFNKIFAAHTGPKLGWDLGSGTAGFIITSTDAGKLQSSLRIGHGFSIEKTPIIKLTTLSEGLEKGRWPSLASDSSEGVVVEAAVNQEGSVDISYYGEMRPGIQVRVAVSQVVNTAASATSIWRSTKPLEAETPSLPLSQSPPPLVGSVSAIPNSFLDEIHSKYMSAKAELSKLNSKVSELEGEVKSLSIENQKLKSSSVLTAWPTEGWVFYEPFGWVYLNNNSFPYFWINQPNFNSDYDKFDLSSRYDFDLKLNGWCYLDASSEDVLIYCFNTASWYNFK